MRGLPLRLALGFPVGLLVVLVGVGALLYVRVGNALDEQVNDALEQRSAAIVQSGELPTASQTEEDAFTGVVGSSTLPVALPADAVRRARTGPVFLSSDGYRVLLSPFDGGREIVAVGASLDDRDETRANLLAELLLAGAVALGFAAVAGYALALAATRPVVRRLEAGLARERRFVADASHELRTPLATLQAELELAARRPRSAGELETTLRSAGEEVERLVRLAEDLLVLARTDHGRLELRTEEVPVRSLLEAVARRFAPRAAAEGRVLVVTGDGSSVTADPLRLEQALGNLVDNALRHGEGTVALDGRRRDCVVRITVSDEGAGVSPALADSAFERFTRADEARSGGGSGLGLAIVEAIVRAHGGSARVDAALVALELPLSRA